MSVAEMQNKKTTGLVSTAPKLILALYINYDPKINKKVKVKKSIRLMAGDD